MRAPQVHHEEGENAMLMHVAGETPVWGPGAIRRWVGLLDAAEAALARVSPHDPFGQRTAGRQLDSLFVYEHQMTPHARRRAREYVWRRDRADTPLPEEGRRAEWEACRCRVCRYERRSGIPSVVRRLQPPPTSGTPIVERRCA